MNDEHTPSAAPHTGETACGCGADCQCGPDCACTAADSCSPACTCAD